jgi:hypothetical protein
LTLNEPSFSLRPFNRPPSRSGEFHPEPLTDDTRDTRPHADFGTSCGKIERVPDSIGGDIGVGYITALGGKLAFFAMREFSDSVFKLCQIRQVWLLASLARTINVFGIDVSETDPKKACLHPAQRKVVSGSIRN